MILSSSTRLLNTVTAVELMTKAVLLVEHTMSLIQAAKILAEKQVSGAPVVDHEKKIFGIVSEKDFLKEMGFGSNPSFMQIATYCLQDKSCMIGNLRGRTVADIINQTDLMMIIGSFGVTAFQLLSDQPWLAASFAVSTSIALMHLTKTLHPPGGAAALIAVIGSDGIHSLGYLYVVILVALGASVMLLIALFVNNIPKNRRYPEFLL